MYDIEYMKLVGRDCLSIHWDSLVPDPPYLYGREIHSRIREGSGTMLGLDCHTVTNLHSYAV